MKDDEYRRFAEQAQQQADKATRPNDRASWLRIAQGWMRMIPRRRHTKLEVLDAESKAKTASQQKLDAAP
jgi:hypothetical protein